MNIKFWKLVLVFVSLPAIIYAETVGIFYNNTSEQIKFAVNDIKISLESKGYSVEMNDLSKLKPDYSNKKIVVSIASNKEVAELLTSEGAIVPTNLGEQAYALRTTKQTTYWVIGGDANGAMYGGLQLAENIQINNFKGIYNLQESPTIRKRGIKLNYPLDERCPTYGRGDDGTFDGIAYKKAIPNVWDYSYWTEWFDHMARDRYNVVSIWMCHPFTSLVKLDSFPDVAIQDIKGFDGFSKTMTIDEKIVFWKKVMQYAHHRGFEFYFINWNVFTYGATDKYGITPKMDNQITKKYMYESMKALLNTYPDLDGFGVTAGERMQYGKHELNEQWLWDTYGKAVYDYALLNPERKIRLIHRFHYAKLSDIKAKFQPLTTLPNVEFNMSFKYSQAHMHAATTPKWWDEKQEKDLTDNGVKTFYTIRNDDFYFHNWGDPDFARAYINGMPGKESYLEGFYMGSDGFAPTRNFFSKNSVSQGMLEVKRQWYMYMIWGRLAYNPSVSDDVFKNQISIKYPNISSIELFDAWKKASAGVPKVSELIGGSLYFDFHWWPEACQLGRGKTKNSLVTIDKFIESKVVPGSSLCSIEASAFNNCKGKKSSYQLADEIEHDAIEAIETVKKFKADNNTEFGITVNNIKAMSYLSIYYAYKIRGATFKKAYNSVETIKALEQAYNWWMLYTNLMDSMYEGMSMQRSDNFENWHYQDANVLQEFHDNGGEGIPILE